MTYARQGLVKRRQPKKIRPPAPAQSLHGVALPADAPRGGALWKAEAVLKPAIAL
jgi:hypothetical protein